MGRTATGVRGITLDEEDDEVVGMVCVYNLEKDTVLVVSEKGYGKRSAVEDYRITNRQLSLGGLCATNSLQRFFIFLILSDHRALVNCFFLFFVFFINYNFIFPPVLTGTIAF